MLSGLTLWAIICALIWWEAEKHSGFPRNVALKWSLICFFFGPFGILFYIVIGRIMGPTPDDFRRREALQRSEQESGSRSPYKPPPSAR